MKTKFCKTCNTDQFLYNFNTKPGSNGKRYYKHHCKFCQSTADKIKNAERKICCKIIIQSKVCFDCNCTKCPNDFTKNVYNSDGYSRTCSQCQANYYINNRDRISLNNKKSQKKHKLKNNLRKMLWAIKNKLKVRKTNQIYYKKNIDKISKYNSKWAKKNALAIRNKSHRYRARKRNNTIQTFTKDQLEQRMSIFGFKCAYCGGNFDHIDHVKALSKGGYHCLSNLRPACKKCNLEKHNKSLAEWLDLRK